MDEMTGWLRAQILARKAAAESAGGAEWTPDDHPSRNAMVIEKDSGLIVVYDEGVPSEAQAAHMILNDPCDTIARCEAELAIVDLYAATRALVDKPPSAADKYPEAVKEHARLYGIPEAGALISARDYLDAKRELAVLEPVIRLLASGYRNRPGYAAQWAP